MWRPCFFSPGLSLSGSWAGPVTLRPSSSYSFWARRWPIYGGLVLWTGAHPHAPVRASKEKGVETMRWSLSKPADKPPDATSGSSIIRDNGFEEDGRRSVLLTRLQDLIT